VPKPTDPGVYFVSLYTPLFVSLYAPHSVLTNQVAGKKVGVSVFNGRWSEAQTSVSVSLYAPLFVSLYAPPSVLLKQVPGKKVGVSVFNGRWNDAQIATKAEALKRHLEGAGHKLKGRYMTAFYNSPFYHSLLPSQRDLVRAGGLS